MTDYDPLRTELENKLLELTRRVEGLEDTLRQEGDSDWSENAVARENQETLVALENATETEIREVRKALERMDSGSYGRCMHCSKPIARSRLKALPWATTCIYCA